MWADDTWINYSIQGMEDPNRPFNYSNYQIWESIQEYNSNVNQYLFNIRQDDLDRKFWKCPK